MCSTATSKTSVDSLTRWWGPGPDWWAAACCWRGHCAGSPSRGRRGRCERCPGQRCRGCRPANPRPSRWAEPVPSAAAASPARHRSARFCTPAGQKRGKSCCSHFNVTDEGGRITRDRVAVTLISWMRERPHHDCFHNNLT